MNKNASPGRLVILVLTSVLIGFLLFVGIRMVRPEGIVSFLPSLLAAVALGTYAGRTTQAGIALLIGATCGALVYLTMIVANSLLFWRDGRLVGDGAELAIV